MTRTIKSRNNEKRNAISIISTIGFTDNKFQNWKSSTSKELELKIYVFYCPLVQWFITLSLVAKERTST